MSLINQIILLQEVDNKLFDIKKLLGDLPSKVVEVLPVALGWPIQPSL